MIQVWFFYTIDQDGLELKPNNFKKQSSSLSFLLNIQVQTSLEYFIAILDLCLLP